MLDLYDSMANQVPALIQLERGVSLLYLGPFLRFISVSHTCKVYTGMRTCIFSLTENKLIKVYDHEFIATGLH